MGSLSSSFPYPPYPTFVLWGNKREAHVFTGASLLLWCFEHAEQKSLVGLKKKDSALKRDCLYDKGGWETAGNLGEGKKDRQSDWDQKKTPRGHEGPLERVGKRHLCSLLWILSCLQKAASNVVPFLSVDPASKPSSFGGRGGCQQHYLLH